MRRFAALLAAFFLSACGTSHRDFLVRSFDAGADGSAAEAGIADAQPNSDPTLGGPCVDDGQCDDTLACTFDTCDETLHRCRNVPDDTACDDHVYCNGKERCVPLHGCKPGAVVTCDDGTACTIDRCVEASKSCDHAPRDADGDGDEDAHCAPGKDCNDADPTVLSTHAEVCKNGKDDNCNGQVDEQPCSTPEHDTCASPLAITAPGTYALSTVAAARDYSASCDVTTPAAAHDVVAAVTIPPGDPRDLDLWATSASADVAVAIFSACGQVASELACGHGLGTTTRVRARSLQPGTYFVVGTTQQESRLELAVDFLAASSKPTNESCASATPIATDQAVKVELVDPTKDLPSACQAVTGERTYAFTLAAAADVRIFSTTTRGNGTPIVGLRNAACTDATDELRCASTAALPVFGRALPAGTYVVTVAATAPIDASIDVRTYPPTTPPADQSCATAPSVALNATPEAISLADHEDAIHDGCSSGRPNAAIAFTIPAPSDVMVIGRFAANALAGVALDSPACGSASDNLLCGSGQTPIRIDKRNVPPGDYRVVLSDSIGGDDTVSVLVRDTVAPTIVGNGADTCASAIDIPQTGGFFTGDTTNLMADFDDGCDVSPSTAGGAPDQVLRLVLSETKRVVLNMDGSVYTTILDVRRGTTCPGQEVAGACYVGFSGPRSFLDLTLPADTYWIAIDGYGGEKGAWNLDVRVLPP